MGDMAGTWERVSSNGQSTESQRPRLDAWCEAKGYEVTRRYTMHGKSASKGEHQVTLDQVVRDMHAGIITVLVVVRSNRIERRGIRNMFDFLGRVQDAGGRVEFIDEPALNDLTGAAGEISLAVAAAMAKSETVNRNAAIKDGRDKARSNGGLLGTCPWGYQVTGERHAKRFTPTADGQEWMPWLFARAAEMSIYRLSKSLGDTPLAGRSPQALAKMIRNQTYLGYVTSADGTVTGLCVPLVSAAAFKTANDALTSRPRSGGAKSGFQRVMLSGVGKCQCGGGMWHDSSTSKTGTRYDYLKCEECGMRVPMGAAEKLVNSIVSGFTLPITRRELVEPGHDHSEAIAAAELELRQLPALGLAEAEEDSRRAVLRAAKRELAGRPVVDPRWDEVALRDASGNILTYASEYAGVDPADRNAWLKAHGLTAIITKDTGQWAEALGDEDSDGDGRWYVQLHTAARGR